MKALLIALLLSSPAAAQQQHGINLTWTPSTSSGVTSQLICRSNVSGLEICTVPLVTIPNGTTSSYLDTTGVAAQPYFYIAESCVGAICSAKSNEASAVFPTVAAPPTALSAVPQ